MRGSLVSDTLFHLQASSITSGAVSGALLSLTLSEHHAWVRAVSAGTQKMTAIQLYRKDNLGEYCASSTSRQYF